MIIVSVLGSCILGISLGIIYGLSFQWTKALSLKKSNTRHFCYGASISLLRIFSIALIFFYLLKTPSVQFILIVVPFFIALWLIIIKNKALNG